MKNLATILSHISSSPQFKSLKRQTCYQKYIHLLSPKWQKAIAFIYIKEETLFIAVKHPGFKMELNYNKDLLKSLLTDLNTHDKSCENMLAKKVVIFHSKYHPMQKEEPEKSTVPYYHERAMGTFTLPKQTELNEAFSRIRKQILSCNKP